MPNVLLEIMSGSAASRRTLKDRGRRMLRTDPEITSTVDIFTKGLGIVLEAGRVEGSLDDSQVIRGCHALNGASLD